MGMTTGHSRPFELCIVTISIAPSDASVRPSGFGVLASQWRCRSCTKFRRPATA